MRTQEHELLISLLTVLVEAEDQRKTKQQKLEPSLKASAAGEVGGRKGDYSDEVGLGRLRLL